MQDQPDVLAEEIQHLKIKRKNLLPWWIKIFMWIFLVFAILVPIALVFAMMGFNFDLALYGLETNEPLSLTGLLLIVIFGLKAVVSVGLLKEKDWAINLGIIDALIGILICIFINYIYPFLNPETGLKISFLPLELLLLVPYLIKFIRIKEDWKLSE